jgi:hypothetical protein
LPALPEPMVQLVPPVQKVPLVLQVPMVLLELDSQMTVLAKHVLLVQRQAFLSGLKLFPETKSG